jgi:hypothetical protein
MHHEYKIDFKRQPIRIYSSRNATEKAMVLKQFIVSELERKKVVVMTSLDVMGAFDAAWWPAILKG